MQRFGLTLFFLFMAFPAFSQSWTYRHASAVAPPSFKGQPTGGPNVGGFAVICEDGDWSIDLYSGISPDDTETSPATIVVDGKPFAARFALVGSDSASGIVLTKEIIEALKAGREVEITFPTGGSFYSATFGLRGSSRALWHAEETCFYHTPATSSYRFAGPSGESDETAVALLQGLLAERLAGMRQEANKLDIDVTGAWFIDLDNGWRFIMADVGFSNYHFGFSQYGSTLYALPPGAEWQLAAWLVSPAHFSIDRHKKTDGWPNLMISSVSNATKPFHLWQWNGREYEFSRAIPR